MLIGLCYVLSIVWIGYLYSHLFLVYLFLTDLYGLMGDPVTASDYYQIHNSCTKKLLDSKLSSLF